VVFYSSVFLYFYICFYFFFFFSSRRRHTRSDRDWSSDVCSSDLNNDAAAAQNLPVDRRAILRCTPPFCAISTALPGWARSAGRRSEERRVGKESRSRRSPPASKPPTSTRGHSPASLSDPPRPHLT